MFCMFASPHVHHDILLRARVLITLSGCQVYCTLTWYINNTHTHYGMVNAMPWYLHCNFRYCILVVV